MHAHPHRERPLRPSPTTRQTAASKIAGVLVPLASSSRTRDTTQLTLAEHHLTLLHASAGTGSRGQPERRHVQKTGGKVFASTVCAPPTAAAATGDSDSKQPPSTALLLATATSGFDRPPSLGKVPSSNLARAESNSRSGVERHAAMLHARQASFRLYANAQDNPNLGDDEPVHGQKEASKAEAGLLPKIIATIASLVGLSDPLQAIAPSFVPFSAPGAAASSVRSSNAASAPVVTSLSVHPSLPVLAVLISDEIHFYDVTNTSSLAGKIGVGTSVGGSAAAGQRDALSTSLVASAASGPVVTGEWLDRILRHPFMAGALTVRFNAIGGNLLAVGTRGGIVCLWSLSSVPCASAASNGATLSGSSSSSSSRGGKAGAWLILLQDAHHAGKPIDSLEFSPCGRWIVSASSESGTFVVWDVLEAVSNSYNCTDHTATPVQKVFSSIVDPHHAAIDLVRWSPDGSYLAVAASERTSSGLVSGLVGGIKKRIVESGKNVWRKATGSAAQQQAGDSPPAASTALSSSSSSSSAGSLTIWSPHSGWRCETFQTTSPVTSVNWSGGSGGAATGENFAADPEMTSSPLLLLSLRGSSFLSSLSLLPASLSSPLSRASLLSLNLSSTLGLPTERGARNAAGEGDLEGDLREYRVGGEVEQAVWSPRGRRIAVRFTPRSFSTGAPNEGAELVALLAVHLEPTETYQVLPIGMIRGPVCGCEGRVHKGGAAAEGTRKTGGAGSGRAGLEKKYNDDEDEEGEDEPEEEKVYPSLREHIPRTCKERNLPVHMAFVNGVTTATELLAISWQFGQITFVPLYYSD